MPKEAKRFKDHMAGTILSESVMMRWFRAEYQIVDTAESNPHTDSYGEVIGKGASMYDALRDTYKRQGKPYTKEEMKK